MQILTKEYFDDLMSNLQKKETYKEIVPCIVYSKKMWIDERKYIKSFKFTDDEIKSAEDSNGFLGNRCGYDCYLSLEIKI